MYQSQITTVEVSLALDDLITKDSRLSHSRGMKPSFTDHAGLSCPGATRGACPLGLHHDHHLPGLTPPEDPPLHPTSQRQGQAPQSHPGRGAPLRAPYSSEQQRRDAVAVWNHRHNYHRPHTACRNQPPTTRTPIHVTHVMTSNT